MSSDPKSAAPQRTDAPRTGAGARLRRLLPRVAVAGAAAAEFAAVWLLATLPGWQGPCAAAIVHTMASLLGLVAARLRRSDLSRVERDIVLWSALLVPLFGPLIAWSLPRPPRVEDAENAHALFEQYAEHVKPADAGYERTLFTGHYARDLSRELDVQSYREVLRSESTDQKRNALRRLAELGEPRHFDLVRSCLVDPSHEVRLYAYSELERAGRVYEEEIATRARHLKRKPGDPPALLALARTYYRYAASGILDRSMAAFYYRAAERYATQASAAGAEGAEPSLVRAAALGRLGEFDEALACLERLPPEAQDAPVSCLTRAEIAYRRRDFATVRGEAERLGRTDTPLPSWLAAIGGPPRGDT